MPLIRCTECQHQVSTAAKQCPTCGHPLINKSQLSDSLPDRVTEATYIKPTLTDRMNIGLGTSGCLVVVSFILLLIPVIGWALFPFFIAAALWGPIQLMFFTSEREIAELQGLCPYCHSSLTVPYKNTSATCADCKLTVVVRNRKFHTLAGARNKPD
jgi:predicted amidophosphoribosyltransferase